MEIAKKLCSSFSFGDKRTISIGIDDLKNLMNMNISPNAFIRVRDSEGNLMLTFAYFPSNTPEYEDITGDLYKDCKKLCRNQINQSYLKKSIKSDTTLGVLVISSNIPNCSIGAFGVLGKNLLSTVSGAVSIDNDKEVGELKIVCAVDNVVNTEKGEKIAWGIGMLCQYISCTIFKNYFDMDLVFGYAASPRLLSYYNRIGWNFGASDFLVYNNLVSDMKYWDEYDEMMHKTGIDNQLLISKVIKRLHNELFKELENEDPYNLFQALDNYELDNIYDPNEEQIEEAARTVADAFVNKNDELLLISISLENKYGELSILRDAAISQITKFLSEVDRQENE